MEEIVKKAMSLGCSFAEAKTIDSKKNTISTSNNKINEISSGTNKIFSIRVLYDGRWGNAFSKEPNSKLIYNAIKNAKFTDKKVEIDILKPIKKKVKTKTKISLKDISLDEKKDMLSKIEKNKPEINNLSLKYIDSITKSEYVNSEGSNLNWDDSLILMVASSYAKKNDRFESFYDVIAKHGGFEESIAFEKKADNVMKKSIELLDAKAIKGGFFPTLIDPHLAGVFAHECIGHACEADLVLNGTSILKDKMNKKIGPDYLNIYDNGELSHKWGWLPYDSEGVPGKNTTLIKNGKLNSYMHTRESAKEFNVEPTGNGRAQNLDNKIIPRMSNTYIGKGENSKEEILESIKKGYYLIGSMGGQVDPASGEFLFNAMEAFSIEKGEIKERVMGASLSGNVMQSLNSISMIGKDIEVSGTGFCGKSGQYVPVGDGGPHFKFEKIKIGGKN
ncbi:TldD/PmbA family protein [archaeon]|jgi:TldD protein|nr:TldD/PmbA family protein [archaeon]MBT4352163.1 TldD/PmbA family protein [archaeon]MBT4648202.1 TldD/PmbA family protein [archaeon]MBT6822252.1 TldD/PmbA family protein [archaeon]MBT7392626.1 TldD/PmbA family protein [archaeon]